MLLVHGTSHGKKTSRRLPVLTILVVREGSGCGHLFPVIFIADLQGLEDVFRGFALGGEILDVGVDGGGRSDGGSGGYRGFRDLSVSDLLGVVIPLGFPRCLRGLAFVCTVSLLAASETKSFSDAPGSISWGELLQANGVDIHGVRIFGRARVGERGEG